MIPKEFEAARQHVTDIAGRSAYLAGGAVRDSLLGKPVKDLDFYVQVDGWADAENLMETLEARLPKGASRCFSSAYVANHYAGVVDFEDPVTGKPAQVVLVIGVPANKVHTKFSEGISQVLWDGALVNTTMAFHADRDAERVSYMPLAGQHRQVDTISRDHAKRIAEKLGWPLMVPA